MGVVGKDVHKGFEEKGGDDDNSLAVQHEAHRGHDWRGQSGGTSGIFVIVVGGVGWCGKRGADESCQLFGDSSILLAAGGLIITIVIIMIIIFAVGGGH